MYRAKTWPSIALCVSVCDYLFIHRVITVYVLPSNNRSFTLQVDPTHLLIFEGATRNSGDEERIRTHAGNPTGLGKTG